MMICDADFEELFPTIFRRGPHAANNLGPSADCVARWEDDGGRPALMMREASTVRPPARHRFARRTLDGVPL